VPHWAYLNVSVCVNDNLVSFQNHSNDECRPPTIPLTLTQHLVLVRMACRSLDIYMINKISTYTGGPESVSPGSATAGAGTTGSTSTSKSSSHSKTSPGAIAGAVVGSIAGALIIAGGILYWLDRRRKVAKRRNERMSETSEGPLYGTSPPPLTSHTTSPPPPTSTTLYSPDQPMVLYVSFFDCWGPTWDADSFAIGP